MGVGRRPDACRPGWWYCIRSEVRAERDRGRVQGRVRNRAEYRRRRIKFTEVPKSVGISCCGMVCECRVELDVEELERFWPELKLDPIRDLRPRGFEERRERVFEFAATRKRLKLEERDHLVDPYAGSWAGGW